MKNKMNLPWIKHCGYCGGENLFNKEKNFFNCSSCGEMSWPQNKTAVCVSVPVWDRYMFKGFIYTERAIPPIGSKCLVSGFQDFGEHYFRTAAREFQEEIFNQHGEDNFLLDEKHMRLEDVQLGANQTINIICVSHTGIQLTHIQEILFDFEPNDEVLSIGLATKPIDLEWPIHTEFMYNEFKRLEKHFT